MLAPVTHILPLTNIRRTRVLPFSGTVLVRPGQKVNATDIIAQARVPSGHILLDIRRGLGIPQVGAAERCITRHEGDRLEKDDIIAESGGLFSRIVRAPAAGEIISVGGAQVLMQVRTTDIDVRAGFNGTVAELVEDYGAIIEANGVLVQGVWGNGKMDSGLLLVVAQSAGDEFVRTSVDVSMRGAVIIAGHCASADALQAGGELPLRGLILSSMSARLIPVAESLSYPIIVVDGFGNIPMNDAAYRLLTTNEKRDVSVNAAYDPIAGQRPEIIIPLPAEGQPPLETDYFSPNQTVRIQGAPYSGSIGTIVQLRQGLFTLPNGLKVHAADIKLGDDSRVTVPLANLEVIA
jgi:hypothetical protein